MSHHQKSWGLRSIGLALLFALCPRSLAREDESMLIHHVDPFIGTGGHGHTHPAASAPFGMVQLGPDTRLSGWDGCSGYHYTDSHIYGFTHTHLSGTGILDYGDILLMPRTGEVRWENGSDGNDGYRSEFRHEDETASPGFYAVRMASGVEVELTVSERVGIHRYKFPQDREAHVLIDLRHRDLPLATDMTLVGNREIEGSRRSRSWADDQRVFFVARFSRPFTRYALMADPARPDVLEQEARRVEGKGVKGALHFAASEEPLLVKVALSSVSVEGARRNLDQEMPHWDFDRVRREVETSWENELRKIEVEGEEESKEIFYTALYHALLCPNVLSDVDGQYRLPGRGVHRAEGYRHHTIFSLWDTFRGAHPLYHIIQRERSLDFIQTFLAHYRIRGRLPVWELWGNETDTMIGYHAVPVIVDAYAKGIRGFDEDLAFEAMLHSATLDRDGLASYKRLGFVDASEESESVSKTLEYAYDDWCIAEMARFLGRPAERELFSLRAQSYENVFCPDTRFMRAKMNQTWFEPFDPREVNFNYTEANAWQYLFYVPHDIDGLVRLFGGPDQMEELLDQMFIMSEEMSGRKQADITGLIGQYAHGNEPSHHMAYLYDYLGKPWKTQRRVREILETMYSGEPDGLCGNEDCGQMSAWYVLSAMGFYPVTPGQPVYAIGSPLFDRVTLHTGSDRPLVIRAENQSPQNVYVQGLSLNGENWESSALAHDVLMDGGELTFIMGPEPNRAWGLEGPRSFLEGPRRVPVPFLRSGDRTFVDKTTLSLDVLTEGASIHYTLDGTDPDSNSAVYEQPLEISSTTIVKARAYFEGMVPSPIVDASLTRIPAGRSIELKQAYASQYSAGGDRALIDSLRGGTDYRSGLWQGYQGVDVEVIVDLGRSESLSRIGLGCLQDIDSWIFMPTSVDILTSDDGDQWTLAGRVENDVGERDPEPTVRTFEVAVQLQARFIRVIARNRGLCPPWHKGAGGKSWIFADEIVVTPEGE